MRSRTPVPTAAAAFLVLLLTAGSAAAQIPEKFTNLKVLPKGTSRAELLGTMRGFSGGLGVRCGFCHAQADTGRSGELDFASDAKKEKRIARAMMKMVREINGKLIPKAGMRAPAAVGCVTCHHGIEHPETLAGVLERTIAKKGLPAAQEQYRELREKYYGSGAYDFRAGSLNAVAEWLARDRQDPDGALEMANLSLEQDPKSADTYITIGQIQEMKGDRGAAIESYRRALELDPGNRRVMERIKAAESGQ
jgi:tetratricopeptide (TPR) repeat protein